MKGIRSIVLFVVTILCVGGSGFQVVAQDTGSGSGASNFVFAGYNKTTLISSGTQSPSNDQYFLGLNRTRIKLTYDPAPYLEFYVENDTQVNIGSYLSTPQSALARRAIRRQYFDLETTIVNGQSLYITNDFFRAYTKVSHDDTDLIVGRQRIPLGTGRLWSALDMLNPLNPLQIERDEYVGVDAAMLEQKLGSLSKITLIYAPDPQGQNDRGAFQYRTNWKGTDVDLTLARYWLDDVFGLDLATQVWGFGVHGEWTYTRASVGDPYLSMVLGFDYAFENTFDISVEGYYNSQNKAARLKQFQQQPLRFQLEPFGTRYAGATLSYEFTPLFKGNLIFLNNLDDRSRFISPYMTYSLTDNTSLQAGVQVFTGSGNSEYGRNKLLLYLQLQTFF